VDRGKRGLKRSMAVEAKGLYSPWGLPGSSEWDHAVD
jgi:hypothetical protein